MTPLLFDFGPVSACCTDHAIESLHKALGEPPDDSIWVPHHDPYVSGHIEVVTMRVMAILATIQEAIEDLIGLEFRKANWSRWSESELSEALAQIKSKDPKEYTLDDWLKVVDWIIQRYLPADVIQTEAEYMAVRAQFAGRIQANIDAAAGGIASAPYLVAAAPVKRLLANTVATLTAREAAVMDFAVARAAEFVTEIGDSTRHRLRKLIIDHEQDRILGRPDATLWNLQSRMQDEFAVLNRDWRRVAMSEVARDANEGLLASLPAESKVRRIEAYDACPFCKKLDGQVFNLVDPSKPDKDGWKDVWLGKTNVGRSASPRKRVGDELVERTESERYWPAAGIQHPLCRGTWVTEPGVTAGADPDFVEWMRVESEKHIAEVLAQGEKAAAEKARTQNA